MTSLNAPSFYDTASFTLPPKVAKMDAVRKLADRLTAVTGIGDTAASVISHAAVDPAAVRATLAEPLPGLTAHPESHLRVIPARVWTPWLTAPADDIPRYRSKKRLPVSDPSVPATPRLDESPNGLALAWKSQTDRAHHEEDNRRLYEEDIYTDRLRIFPGKGGILTPLVLVPQTETFEDGDLTQPPSSPLMRLSDDGQKLALHTLRIVDGRRRFYEVQDVLRQFARLDEAGLRAHFGRDMTPEVFQEAIQGDRDALAEVVNAIRDACISAGHEGEQQQYIGVHYLASVISMPAYIAVGTVDPDTSEVRPLGTDTGYPTGTRYTLETGLTAWHTGKEARVIATGQKEHNGLLLPEGSVDETMVEVAVTRLRARGVPKDIAEYGASATAPAAARFAWWARAVRQIGGTPATAVAAFATTSGSPLPQGISQALLTCASYLMEEDIDIVYPAGDYRKEEERPESLTHLVADARNLTPVASLSQERKGLLAHPRWRNAMHIALAHLALTGALPSRGPLPGHVLNPHLLSRVALAWVTGQIPVVATADGTEIRDAEGRTIPIDGRTLGQPDPEWAKRLPYGRVEHMTPPAEPATPGASHAFTLRHGVEYTIPTTALKEVEATAESVARAVRRWFPGATGVTLTDWSDRLVTGVMVGSVWVRLYDRSGERDEARHRGAWYPEGRPAGTKDEVDIERNDSGFPVGVLVGADEWIAGRDTVDAVEAEEVMVEELDGEIIQQIDDALEVQKAADEKAGKGPDIRWDVPVLRLPELRRSGK